MSLQRPSIRYGTRVVCGIVLFLLLVSPILASPLQQVCATMGFSPTSASDVQVGDIVILQVLLDADGVTFDTVGFLINFDQTLLQVVDAEGDPVTPGDFPGTTVMNTASNAQGTIDFSQAIFPPNPPQTGGDFTVGTIRFEVIATLPEGGTQVAFVSHSNNTGVFREGPPNLLCEAPQPATITPTTTTCYDFQPPPGVGIEDVMVVANLWGQSAGPPYDCDGDGVITVVDIMCVVLHWGETCP